MAINIEYPKSILQAKLFESLKDADMRLLIRAATLKRYKVGDVVVKEGETGGEFYWISSGRVEIVMNPTKEGGAPVSLGMLNPGDIFGEMVLLGFNKRAATAIVRAEAQIYAWPVKQCLDLFLDQPSIGYRVTRNLGHMLGLRLISTNKQIRAKTELMDAALAREIMTDT